MLNMMQRVQVHIMRKSAYHISDVYTCAYIFYVDISPCFSQWDYSI